MLTSQRKQRILEQLAADGQVLSKTLSETFGVSEDTIRRDLRELSAEGLLQRVHGGALPASAAIAPFAERKTLALDSKRAIARRGAALIEPGQVVIIDGGTTTDALARLLPKDDSLRIITNNLLALNTLSSRDIPVTLIGGDLRRGSMSVYGSLADMALERLTFDKVFCSADGIDAEFGVCEGSIEQAWFKEKLFRRTREVYLLATAEKLGRKSQMNWSPIHRQWTLITDAAPESHAVQAFGNHPFVTVVPVA